MAKTCTPTAFHRTYVITHYTVWYSLVCWSAGSDCFLTSTELLQSSFLIQPRTRHSGDLRPIVLVRIRAWLPCSHMSKQTELRGEMRQVPKQRVRCESTLRLELETRTRNVEWLRSVAIARRVINARPVVPNLFFMAHLHTHVVIWAPPAPRLY